MVAHFSAVGPAEAVSGDADAGGRVRALSSSEAFSSSVWAAVGPCDAVAAASADVPASSEEAGVVPPRHPARARATSRAASLVRAGERGTTAPSLNGGRNGI